MSSLMPGPLHDWSGFLPFVRIGSLELPTYFLIISLTMTASVYWLTRRAQQKQLRQNDALDIAMVAMISGFLGSRFLHVFFEEPRYYWNDPIQVLHIERGGFVWFGGLIAGFGASLAWIQWRKLDLKTWLNVFAPLLAFGYAMGRVACLLTGCCFGRICALPSGFIFRYPTQAFAVVWELAVLVILLGLEVRGRRGVVKLGRAKSLLQPGELFWIWLILHSTGRVIMETFRDDDRGPLILGLSVSTLLSILFLGLSIFQIRQIRRPKSAASEHK